MAPRIPHTGYGLMGFTWGANPIPDERAFPAMKAAVESGATLWSSSSVYGPPGTPTAGLQLLRQYFQLHPEDASKVTLFIRGCFDAATFTPTCTREGVRASWEEVNGILGGVKTLDVFGPARMDPNVPVEETISALKELQDEGKIGAVGLSEVRAETIRRAAAVTRITFAEIEFSLWSTAMLDNGIAAAARECNVTIMAYSPLGYGFLTGKIRTLDDLPENDNRSRRSLPRFQPENFSRNLELVKKVEVLASKKNITTGQLALAWIRSHSNTGVCGTLIPIPGATAAERVAENSTLVEITYEEKAELDEILKSIEIVGGRHRDGMERFQNT